MRTVLAIALAVFYVGVSLVLGGATPASGMPWWFFVPCAVAMGGALAAKTISALFPLPWTTNGDYGPAPRRVRLSWQAAVRLPVWAPTLLVPWHILTIVRMHFDLDGLVYLALAAALAALVPIARRRRRDIRLLRRGAVAAAFVTDRDNTQEWGERISYRFATATGTTVDGRAFCTGYDVRAGASVPVFFDADNPAEHVLACASWFHAG